MRKAILTGVVTALAIIAVPAASASADTTSCENNATIKLSPGLSNTPQIQNVTVKGTLSNCSGEESTATSGKYVAHLKTTEATTCAALASAAATEGTIVIKWSPKGAGNSMGTFSMPITELPTTVSGLVEKGPFEGDTIGGSVTQSYTGGPTCGIAPEGKKKAKKVNKGTLSGTLTIS
jgi:hypothetical protein